MKEEKVMNVKHNISPVYHENSNILILGSFPSVKSREQEFFYGHPKNRFWKVTAAVFGVDVPNTVKEKEEFLLSNKIALWDVIASCDIKGSSDSSIKNVIPNDLKLILNSCDIRKIFTNGKTAEKLYKKYICDVVNRVSVCLPSTSPANAAWTDDKLIEAWKIIIS